MLWLKFRQTFVNDGPWNGKQICSLEMISSFGSKIFFLLYLTMQNRALPLCVWWYL